MLIEMFNAGCLTSEFTNRDEQFFLPGTRSKSATILLFLNSTSSCTACFVAIVHYGTIPCIIVRTIY